MYQIPVSQFKARFSQVLALVESGEEILVTKRGIVVARVVPARSEDADSTLRELERRGVLRRGTGTLPEDFWQWPCPEVPGNAGLRALLADREEGR